MSLPPQFQQARGTSWAIYLVPIAAALAYYVYSVRAEERGEEVRLLGFSGSSSEAEPEQCEWGDWLECNSSGEQVRPVTKGSCAAKFRPCEEVYVVQVQSDAGDEATEAQIRRDIAAQTGVPESEIELTPKQGVSEPSTRTYVVTFKGGRRPESAEMERLTASGGGPVSVTSVERRVLPAVDCEPRWGPWGPCGTDCVQTRSVVEVLRQPSGAGSPCPTAPETRSCCGGASPSSTAAPLVVGTRPPASSTKKTCEFTWSEWTACPPGCGGSQRRVPVVTGGSSAADCPAAETRACPSCDLGEAQSAELAALRQVEGQVSAGGAAAENARAVAANARARTTAALSETVRLNGGNGPRSVALAARAAEAANAAAVASAASASSAGRAQAAAAAAAASGTKAARMNAAVAAETARVQRGNAERRAAEAEAAEAAALESLAPVE